MNIVNIYKDSKWANPFQINSENNRNQVLEKYRNYIISDANLYNSLDELENKKIGCYCKPRNKCHGDVLKELLEEKKENIQYYKNIFLDLYNMEYETYFHYMYHFNATIIDPYHYKKTHNIIMTNGITIIVEQGGTCIIMCPINNPIIRRNLNLKNLLNLI